MPPLSHLQIRNPKDDETSFEAATQIFSSLYSSSHIPLWKRAYVQPKNYSFEIYFLAQTVYFYVTVLPETEIFVQSLLSSSYPKSNTQKTADPLDILLKSKNKSVGEMVLNSAYYLPIKTYTEFSAVDPLSSLLGFLSKQSSDLKIALQILIAPPSFPWQSTLLASTSKEEYNSKTGQYTQTQNPAKAMMLKKTAFQGAKTLIRIMAASDNPAVSPRSYLQNMAGTFGTFSLGEGNQLRFKRPMFFEDRLVSRMKNRSTGYMERQRQILNAQELATLWHPPGMMLAGIKNIMWGKKLAGEPPQNLPTADSLDDEQKKEVNFFAKTEFKNKDTIFGIKDPDRRKHVYVIGKTGAGKTTLIANMAIDDIRKGRGVGIVDPHGDLSETILEYIPKRRINDVVYLEPFDTERPFALNVLEIKNKQHKDLISSGIVSIFFKIYGDSWGPRLEYILRNIIMTLLEVPDATLADVLTLISDDNYRKKIVAGLQDPVIKSFWENEYARMPDKLKAEAISPIQNKVGQFVSSKMMRNIIGQPKSTIDLEDIMNSGKILILNLSQGKLGEDNAALLGAMMITQLQLAAMNRSFIKEEDRRDFFLYVDEFQNFATSSFIKILSEARKYRLALTLTNQYIEQLDETITKAIFGNVGSLMSFVVGARDARWLTKEFAEIYTENELVSLGKHEVIVKLAIDNMTSAPFPALTLPLPSLKNENSETIIRLSKEKYGRKS